VGFEKERGRMRKRHLCTIAVVVAILLAALILASCGSSSTTTTAAPAGGSSTTAAGATTTSAGGSIDAAALYAQYCQGCHKTPPSASADAAKAAIENGKGSMPSFTDKMTADQIAALAAWVANGGK
jgi:mono/diheme cytochrome c family protein